MTNILPQEYKKQIKREYRMRLLSTTLILLSFMIIGATALLIPSYFMSDAVEKTFEGQLAGFTEVGAQEDELRDDLARTQREITILRGSAGEEFSVEATVRLIVSLTPPGVSLTRVSLKEGDEYAGSVSGMAPTRDDLQFFVERLREQKEFEEVELPVSDLARGSNIPFSITFKLSEVVQAEATPISSP